jgi:hypothetical protein
VVVLNLAHGGQTRDTLGSPRLGCADVALSQAAGPKVLDTVAQDLDCGG